MNRAEIERRLSSKGILGKIESEIMQEKEMNTFEM